jgi:Glycine/D-amino acid oxidases (deaminating)
MERKERIAIIGAGIQGVCAAIFLQKKGFNVTLFDRDEPGNAASYGNAGHFSPYASLQLNRTDILSDVPSMLLSSRGPLALKWNYIPKMIPWFTRFIFNSSKAKMMHTAKFMHQILDLSLDAFDELFQDIDLDGLVVSNGIIYVWEKKGLKSRELEINIRKELGVDQQILNPKEINDLEPNLKPFYHGSRSINMQDMQETQKKFL